MAGMDWGDGQLYGCISPECYNSLMIAINDPDNYLFEGLADDCVDPADFISALQSMVRGQVAGADGSTAVDVYYVPDPTNSVFEDALMTLEIYSDEYGVDCSYNALVLLNSHQGVGGM